MEKPARRSTITRLLSTRDAAEILGRSPATLKRWRHEGIGPNWIELEGRVGYDVGALLDSIQRNTRLLPRGLQWRKLVKLFRKPKSKFYWHDFTVRGQRYRGSTQETKVVRAATLASLKLA